LDTKIKYGYEYKHTPFGNLQITFEKRYDNQWLTQDGIFGIRTYAGFVRHNAVAHTSYIVPPPSFRRVPPSLRLSTRREISKPANQQTNHEWQIIRRTGELNE
jgi:hypothetical protein